jgi:hypothetical protein
MCTRAVSAIVIQTPGSNSVPSPTSSRPASNDSSTLPWTGQRQNARRCMKCQWIRARFHGMSLRWYQRHFWAQSFASAGRLTDAKPMGTVRSRG